MEPPGPIPNPEVKRRSADGSETIGLVRVGRRQVFAPPFRKKRRGSFLSGWRVGWRGGGWTREIRIKNPESGDHRGSRDADNPERGSPVEWFQIGIKGPERDRRNGPTGGNLDQPETRPQPASADGNDVIRMSFAFWTLWGAGNCLGNGERKWNGLKRVSVPNIRVDGNSGLRKRSIEIARSASCISKAHEAPELDAGAC